MTVDLCLFMHGMQGRFSHARRTEHSIILPGVVPNVQLAALSVRMGTNRMIIWIQLGMDMCHPKSFPYQNLP